MGRKTKEEAEETRHNILLAALDVFTEKGYSRTTFVDIAKRIGMTKGPVYWHFKHKPSLLAALMQEMHEREEALVAEQVSEVTSLDDLKAYFLSRIRVLTQDAQCRKFGFFVLLQMEWSVEVMAAFREEMTRFREEPFAKIQYILAAAKSRGQIAEDVDIKVANDILVSTWIGLLMAHFQGISSTDPVVAADAAFEAVINSFKA
ncbi:MAG: TetR family transcriptional regulator [Candidatus Hydrogenedentes bacterium]|nr:TetR family transcriptional regulator [Candidatus Hydrogenedentota bacterium]